MAEVAPWESDDVPLKDQPMVANPWTQEKQVVVPTQVAPAQEAPPEVAPWDEPARSWSDVPGEALKNAPGSALEFGKSLVHPFLHPVETYENVRDLGHGVLAKTGVMSSAPEQEAKADAVGRFFKDRYGSAEGLKKTLATDPVGALADASTVLTGGGALAARAPGMVGKIGQVARAAGKVADPLALPIKGAELGAKGAAGAIGFNTGAGGEAIKTAAKAGYEGGEAAKAFQDNMRGAASMDEVVDAARQGISALKEQRGTAYKSGMVPIKNDKTILSFNDVDAALGNSVKTYKGVSISPKVEGIRNEMWDAVEKWKNLQASEFHTPEGFDALKQLLGDIRNNTEHGTPARLTADRIYNGVKASINKQAPEYAKVMKGYEEATKQIKEIEKELSLGPKANPSTSLRKLQSILRDNVSSAYGRRKELAQFLVDAGSPELMEQLAGQALKSPYPRGIGGLASKIGIEMGAILGIGHASGVTLPAIAGAAAVAPFTSPRLMGEGAYYAGKAAKPISKVLPDRPARSVLFQTGREGEGDKAPWERKKGGRVDTRQAVHRVIKRIKGS